MSDPGPWSFSHPITAKDRFKNSESQSLRLARFASFQVPVVATIATPDPPHLCSEEKSGVPDPRTFHLRESLPFRGHWHHAVGSEEKSRSLQCAFIPGSQRPTARMNGRPLAQSAAGKANTLRASLRHGAKPWSCCTSLWAGRVRRQQRVRRSHPTSSHPIRSSRTSRLHRDNGRPTRPGSSRATWEIEPASEGCRVVLVSTDAKRISG